MGKRAKLKKARDEIEKARDEITILRYREKHIADIVFSGHVLEKSVSMVLDVQRMFPERRGNTWEESDSRIVAVDTMRAPRSGGDQQTA